MLGYGSLYTKFSFKSFSKVQVITTGFLVYYKLNSVDSLKTAIP